MIDENKAWMFAAGIVGLGVAIFVFAMVPDFGAMLGQNENGEVVSLEPYSQALRAATNAEVVNLQVCGYTELLCSPISPTNDIIIYWQILNGVGCCNTFGCDYALYKSFCGAPYGEFLFYDIALDGELHDWTTPQHYSYECSYNTPWEYFTYVNVSEGLHSVTIWQKDCQDIVDIKTINFELINREGYYELINR